MATQNAAPQFKNIILNTAADLPDIRDRYYEPALIQLPKSLEPLRSQLHIRNQGRQGDCTAFSLAAAIDLLNFRRGQKKIQVSVRMLYEMARRFDEWTGEDYEGSSLRGAIRGWHHTGVCEEKDWPYDATVNHLTVDRARSAKSNTLGAYYRLRPQITDFHAALNEAGVLCASARVHDGWFSVKKSNPLIKIGSALKGGHAFCIVGYNQKGFLVQNSWGPQWGDEGVALWLYEDWALNLMDAWVFRLALPLPQIFGLRKGGSGHDRESRAQWAGAPRRDEIAGHFVHIDDGKFSESGRYHSSKDDVRETARQLVKSSRNYQHLMFYGHGGLNSPKSSAKRIRGMKDVFKENGIYPYHFMYDTGLAEELKDIIFRKSDEAEHRVGGLFDFSDRIIEKLARKPGTAFWDEMKRDARVAFDPDCAGYITLKIFLEEIADSGKKIKIHLVGHSTGGILMAYLLNAMDGLTGKVSISSCSLLAPASTISLFNSHYKNRLTKEAPLTKIQKMIVYNLTDELERDDKVAVLYRKSLLYLVSNSFERDKDGKPLLGMQKFSKKIKVPKAADFKIHYSGQGQTKSESHGGFDNDTLTMNNVLKTILGKRPTTPFTKKGLDY